MSSDRTSTASLFDSHAHLDVAAFDIDRDAVWVRACAAGVDDVLVPAIAAASWPTIAALCEHEPLLHPAYGLHPCFLSQHRESHLDELRTWLETHPAAAIGECGLDFADPMLDRDRQQALLRGQLELARHFDLPVVLHARRAFDAVIGALREFGKPLRGVVHSFSGSEEQAHALHTLGFMVGIGGPVTYPRAQRLRRVVAALPLESLLLETDSPDQAGAAHRGERNEPAYLVEVCATVAALRGEDPAHVAAATRANACRLFGITL